ncbi:MAG: hypothetical protein RBS13_06235 [Bacteroidales bacterium]|jgi:hypothetical protein|nr:hypothetical protein [Bacteroidales bacterium]
MNKSKTFILTLFIFVTSIATYLSALLLGDIAFVFAEELNWSENFCTAVSMSVEYIFLLVMIMFIMSAITITCPAKEKGRKKE